MILLCALGDLIDNDVRWYLAATLQGSSHLLLGRAERQNIVVLVVALHEARGAQGGHVTGTKVLKGKVVAGAAPHPQQLNLGLHQRVALEGLLLVVPLKMPGAQRDLALQAGLHRRQWVVNAVVAENRSVLGPGFGLNHNLLVYLVCGSSITVDDVGKFEVLLQHSQTLVLFATLRASRRYFAVVLGRFSSLDDTSSAVVVPTGEDHWVTVELEADGTTQLLGKLPLWF